MENKKTAIEWLYDTIIIFPESIEDLAHNARSFKQAQQMEKEQIVNAWTDGFMSTGEGWNGEIPPECYGQVLDNEEYYNKMFNLK